MKLIFLDIDGVLNFFKKHTNSTLPTHAWTPAVMKEMGIELRVFPVQIKRFNKIVKAIPEVKIVLSSSWRVGYLADWADVVIYLHNMGLQGFILGRTPHEPHLKTRGEEINAWLVDNELEEIESFVILDDNGDMTPFVNEFVQTNHQKGLQEEDIEKAIEILKGE